MKNFPLLFMAFTTLFFTQCKEEMIEEELDSALIESGAVAFDELIADRHLKKFGTSYAKFVEDANKTDLKHARAITTPPAQYIQDCFNELYANFDLRLSGYELYLEVACVQSTPGVIALDVYKPRYSRYSVETAPQFSEKYTTIYVGYMSNSGNLSSHSAALIRGVDWRYTTIYYEPNKITAPKSTSLFFQNPFALTISSRDKAYRDLNRCYVNPYNVLASLDKASEHKRKYCSGFLRAGFRDTKGENKVSVTTAKVNSVIQGSRVYQKYVNTSNNSQVFYVSTSSQPPSDVIISSSGVIRPNVIFIGDVIGDKHFLEANYPGVIYYYAKGYNTNSAQLSISPLTDPDFGCHIFR